MAELKALLFDVDGTLAETERDAHLPAFNETFIAHGLDWYWSEALYGELLKVSGGKERMKYYVDHYRPDYVKPDNFDDMIAGLHAEKTRRYVNLVESGGVNLRPGIKRLLGEARQAGMRLAIATTTTFANVEVLLKSNMAENAMEWFEVIGAAEHAAVKKPAPDVYEYVLEKLNLSAAECLAFEDSANGLRAALEASIPVLVTYSEYTQSDDFSGAKLVLDHLGEPTQAFSVRSGTTDAAGFMDLAALQRFHAQF